MMSSVFTCWCFRVRVLVLGGSSLAFSLINGINLWRQVSGFRNSTLDDQVWSLKLCVHFLVIEAWWGFFPHLFMLWLWDRRAVRIEVVEFPL
jgi:hypothetical protein